MKDQKDKQCRFIFKTIFDHIYQGCQKFWPQQYIYCSWLCM